MADNKNKRGAKGGGTVRQRPDGKWEARCTINGKRRSFYADKQADALKQMREALKDNDDGIKFNPTTLTVGQWLDIWYNEYYKDTIRQGTQSNTLWAIYKHIKPAIGQIKLKKLDTSQIQMFINSLTKVNGLSSSSAKKVVATLRQGLVQAMKLRYIVHNPIDACTMPKRKKSKVEPLSDSEIKNFLAEIEADIFKDLFTVALFTGMRLGEVCGLPWDAVNFANGTITVKQQLCQVRGKNPDKEKDRYYIAPTKNGKERTLTVPGFVMRVFKEIRQEQAEDHLKMGFAWNNHWNLVFTDKAGNRIPHHNVYSHFKEIAARIGKPTARFHDLRHTYAVISLQEGDSPKTVQENLGHATAAFTLEVYAHVSDKMKQDSANRMQSFYDQLQKKA